MDPGRRVYDLSFGEPWFGPPPHLDDALWAEVKGGLDNRYSDTIGSAALREVLAHRYATSVDPDAEVLVTAGGAEAFALAVLTCSEPGDAVLIPSPGYTLYAHACRTLGRRPVRFPRSVGDGYSVRGPLEEALKRVQASIVVINSPENPTGWVCPPGELAEIMTLCAERGAWLVHDEVYDDFLFDGRSHTNVLGLPAPPSDGYVLINSFSKRFGMPGLRLGWIVAPRDVARMMGRAHDYLTMAASPISQSIANLLLRHPEADGWQAKVAAAMEQRRDVLVAAMTQSGLMSESTLRPGGAMFLFLEATELVRRLSRESGRPNTAVGAEASILLDELCGVITVEGSAYGPSADDHIRIVFAVPEATLLAAITAIDQATARLS